VDERKHNKLGTPSNRKQSSAVGQRIGSHVNATKNAHTVLHGAEEFNGNVKWNMLVLERTRGDIDGEGMEENDRGATERCSINRDRRPTSLHFLEKSLASPVWLHPNRPRGPLEFDPIHFRGGSFAVRYT